MHLLGIYDKLCICDIYLFLAHSRGWARDQKEVINMNKYEIAVILNVNLEEEARIATIEKVKVSPAFSNCYYEDD